MSPTYTTVQGEMWDFISRKVYGSERFMNVLIRANRAYLQVVSFDSGAVLQTPEIVTTRKISSVPWGTIYALN
jgi:hypothetical protein